MSNYRFELINSKLNELQGKFRTIISSWTLVTDGTYGSCYRATVTHNFGGANLIQGVTCWDMSTNEQIIPLACRLIDSNSFYVFMPINTINVGVVVN